MAKSLIITRPLDRSDNIRSKLEHLNYNVILLPCLEIMTISSLDDLKAESVEEYKIIIFVSVSAVDGFFHNYQLSNISKQATVMAVGSATATALESYGVEKVIFPRSEFEQKSEFFVNLPELVNIKNSKVLLVRGDSSREYIAEKIKEREALLKELIVYQTVKPDNLENYIQQARLDTLEVHNTILFATSVSILNNLATGLESQLFDRVKQFCLVVPSARIVKIALDQGYSNVINSNTMHEDSIIELINDIK